MVHVELQNVSLQFRTRRRSRRSLVEVLCRTQQRGPAVLETQALQDVSFRVAEGERLGIVGHNGAGKSSLLRAVAGIYKPTHGKRSVNGRISSLFEISLGFEPDANGWENIAFRGYLQGETPRTLRTKLHEVAEFSELGAHLDVPVRCYSAGMMVRLAFSIATAVDPEILLIDEALGAGDLSFQHKARARIEQLVARSKLLILVSHDLDSLANLCQRLLWLDHGRIRMDGPPADVLRAYRQHMDIADRVAA